MAAPSSSTNICNLALDYLGQKSINDIESPSNDVERICARWYDATRRRVLRLHAWNFAVSRASLAKLSDAPLFGYDGAYPVPSDWVRMISVGASESGGGVDEIDYEIEGGNILASIDESSALRIRYVSDFTNVSGMDALFVDLLSIELALRISFKFTQSNDDVSRLKALRDDVVNEAHGADGQERPIRRVETSRVLQNRRRSGSSLDASRHESRH